MKPAFWSATFLLGQAFRMMVEVGSASALLGVLFSAAAVIAEGEVAQLRPPKAHGDHGGRISSP